LSFLDTGEGEDPNSTSSTAVFWLGPRFGMIKVFDGTNRFDWVPALQGGLDW